MKFKCRENNKQVEFKLCDNLGLNRLKHTLCVLRIRVFTNRHSMKRIEKPFAVSHIPIQI